MLRIDGTERIRLAYHRWTPLTWTRRQIMLVSSTNRRNSLANLRSLGILTIAIAFTTTPFVHADGCRGDFDHDGMVENQDLALMLANWGRCEDCEADLDDDDVVDSNDVIMLMESWGLCPSVESPPSRFQENADGTITSDGRMFESWTDYISNTDPLVWRCGTKAIQPVDGRGFPRAAQDRFASASFSDCQWDITQPREQYQPNSPTGMLCLPVVVHVLRDNAGLLGDIPADRILSQIEVLNTRFASAAIRFHLATVSPNGESTLGIRYYDNTAWYLDQGDYWTSIAWDTSRYLNIYTNSAGGHLGYATWPWPQNGSHPSYGAGDPRDRVVIRSSSFGLNPAAAPFHLGLTCVHEIGHYLGLYHTFEPFQDLDSDGRADSQAGPDGCGLFRCCHGTGDLCCDTNRENFGNSGCLPANASCYDGPDPIDNYMNYSNDDCLTTFTREQIGRMRCSLMTWRGQLPMLPGMCSVPGDLNSDGVVNAADLAVLLAMWGQCQTGSSCPADLNGDGFVNAADLAMLLTSWPSAAPPPRTVPDWATLIEALPDPTVVTNAALRDAIIDTGLAWRVRHTATGIEMLLVPPGAFNMGCSQDPADCYIFELPVHAVTLTCPFYIGRYEVTQAQWESLGWGNPSFFSEDNGFPDSEDRPVESVSQFYARSWTGSYGLRLPTEAEWEFACRAGTTTPIHSGPGFPDGTTNQDLLSMVAVFYEVGGEDDCPWYSDCPTQPVGQKAANALGLHDMLGNVSEWCLDDMTAYPSESQVNPVAWAGGGFKVHRGGGLYFPPDMLRSGFRLGGDYEDEEVWRGFRVVGDLYSGGWSYFP